MSQRNRLRGLQVREARHEGRDILPRPAHQRALKGRHQMARLRQRAARPEAEIRHHLVIARARGVQPPGRLADQLLEPRLDVHVDVFEFAPEGKRTRPHLDGDRVEPALDGFIVRRAQDAHLGQHVGMRPAPGHILLRHPPVHIQRGIDLVHDGRGRCGKTATPHCLAFT